MQDSFAVDDTEDGTVGPEDGHADDPGVESAIRWQSCLGRASIRTPSLATVTVADDDDRRRAGVGIVLVGRWVHLLALIAVALVITFLIGPGQRFRRPIVDAFRHADDSSETRVRAPSDFVFQYHKMMPGFDWRRFWSDKALKRLPN